MRLIPPLSPGRAGRRTVAAVATIGVALPTLGVAAASQAATTPPTNGVEVRWSVTDDWGSGFQASAEIINHTRATLNPWQVQLTYPQAVTSMWDGGYTATPTGFKVAGPNWSKSLAPGSTAKVGLVGKRLSPGSLAPTSCAVAGTTCVVTGADVPQPAPVTPEPTPTVTSAPSTSTPTSAPASPASTPRLLVELENSSDWGSGRTVNATVTNQGASPTASWNVSMPWNGSISAWSADASVRSGSLTAKNVSWNGAIAPGANTTFGFTDNSPAMANPTSCTAQVNGIAADCSIVVRGIQSSPAPTSTPTATAPAPAPTATESPSTAPTPDPTQSAPTPSPGAPKPPAGKKTVAYYTAWGTYGRDYQVSDIPADQLTHINYAFANVAGGKCAIGDAYADTDKFFPGDSWDAGAKRGNFNQLNKLKQQHPGLSTLISVGGWTWSANFSDVASTPAKRSTFAKSCADFMIDNGFDGIDIDWEYPVSGGLKAGSPADKHNYTLLLQQLRSELDARGQANGGKHYLLTIAAPAGPGTRANLEANNIGKSVDWINVMTYDLHGAWDSKTGHNAPLYATPGDPGDAQLNIDSAITGYLNAGVDSKKLVLGVPFYGHSMSGAANANGGLFQPHTGAGLGTWEKGSVDYHDIVDNYLGTYTRYWDDNAKVPYLYDPATKTFVSYDDPESMAFKAKYIAEKDLGGGMFWELSGDTSDYALLDSLNNGM